MKIALVCSLVLGAMMVVKAGDFCALNAEKRISVLQCLGEKLPIEMKGKLLALNTEGSPLPDFVNQHCDKGTDYVEVFKKELSTEELAALKTAYGECASAYEVLTTTDSV